MSKQGSKRGGLFPTTHDSLFLLTLDDSDRGQAILEQLITAYQPAIYAHVLDWLRGDRDTAEDYSQDFILRTKFLKSLMASNRPDKGRFRSYLLKALANFLKDKFKTGHTQKSGGTFQYISVDTCPEEAQTAEQDADGFNLEWARIVIGRTLYQMQQDCERDGRTAIWEVFDRRLVRPILHDEEPVDYAELTRQFGFESPLQTANVLTTGKRKCIACLKAVIAEYERDGNRAVRAELEDLKQLLARLQSPAKEKSEACAESRRPSRRRVRTRTATACERTPPHEPRQLAQFLDLAMNGDDVRLWHPEELQAVFAHQLAAPVQVDLAGLPGDVSATLKLLGESQGLLLRSYGDLFRHRHPPVELLMLVKDFAKSHMTRSGGLLPRDVAKALYCLSIAAALARCARRITALSDADLRGRFDWVVAQPWIDAPTKEVVQQARACLPAVPEA